MPTNYLHDQKDFPELLAIVSSDMDIIPQLVEKDYWLMHVLYGLKKKGFAFELKGGTSLSKGYSIIERFSEDIDIHITPPEGYKVNTNPKSTKAGAIASRKAYYDQLAQDIQIDGIVKVERDTTFDNTVTYNSGGIRLLYESKTDQIAGIKEGILLEAGFDTVTPNSPLTISSWAFNKAQENPEIDIIDNRAVDIPCYHPGYTFVEKLQTIATKFRQEMTDGKTRQNLMRQYYDVYHLLGNEQVQDFIGMDEYHAHKKARFPNKDLEIPIAENQAFLLEDPKTRDSFRERYKATAALYYKEQPEFDELLHRIKEALPKL